MAGLVAAPIGGRASADLTTRGDAEDAEAFDVRLLAVGVSREPPAEMEFSDRFWGPPKEEFSLTLLVTHATGPVLGILEKESYLGPRPRIEVDAVTARHFPPNGIARWMVSRDATGLILWSEDLIAPPPDRPHRVRGVLSVLTASHTEQEHIPAARLKPSAQTFGFTKLDWLVSNREQQADPDRAHDGLQITFFGDSGMRVRGARFVDPNGRPIDGIDIGRNGVNGSLTLLLPRQENLHPDWRLELDIWSRLKKVKVPVDLANPEFEAVLSWSPQTDDAASSDPSADSSEDAPVSGGESTD